MEDPSSILHRLQKTFRSGVTIPESFRRTQLQNLLALVQENEQLILDALHKDLSKPKFEAFLSEIDMVANDLHYTLDNFYSWMQLEYSSKNLATRMDKCFVRREPLGVVLIIGAWNYPLHLILLPLVGAIAAGNCVLLKPSEISQATEQLLAELIPKYLSKDCYSVVCGGAEYTKALLENKFDHIFYTGSQAVARTILQAAAVHLTPVTLELGGKCPCIIYGHIDIPSAARRLVWSKFFNAGQSCVAPDYVLCSAEIRDALLPAVRQTLKEFYGEDARAGPDMGRIINPHHWNRLMELLEKSRGKVVMGGEGYQEDRYIAPTVLVDVEESDILMQEEIFGPILPILTVKSLEEATDFVNRRAKPLAVYVFSDEHSVVTTVLENTSSGGFCANDGIVHMALPGLPFGGVGASGFGHYHGRWTFETFSHRRGCMMRSWALEKINVLRYPPYSDSNLSWLRWATSAKKSWISCSIM
ncbi:aldehyde dehydrogenase family 3 member B1 [Aplochiton taeniatus]